MASFPGGTAVKRGYYIDGRQFEFATVERDGEALPGGPDRHWIHLPVIAVVAAAPALGSLFVLTLPAITLGLAAYAIARKVALVLGAGAREVAATLSPELRPGEAHLTGKPNAGEAAPPAAPPPDAKLDALEKDIEQARKRQP
ncbi:hypothetical protein [Anaeromyxobacter diazotrophicus]|uniref:Uncharacterized protein n=1 Tax=Anaeromyxobacter diazotrophicus TaxID=2590199 RepID=A0A7I9VIP4_9BACT|nr:hypothetical protein [Anaeromyxobacter diazotrophicus]GEJ56010.1 hypothetical protein AMYX_07510 [Anaeromyxobacter diazotrophicus]